MEQQVTKLLEDKAASFFGGFVASIRALVESISNQDVQSVHKRVVGSLLALTVLIWVGFKLVFLPLHLILWWMSFVINTSRFSNMLSQWSSTLIFLLPMIMSLILRYVYYNQIEACFFAILKENNPDLAAELLKKAPRSSVDSLKYHIKKMVMVLMYLPVLTLVSMIPGVNFMAKMAWQAYTLSRYFELQVAALLALLSLVPFVEVYISWGIQAFLAQIFLFTELLYPYLSRAQMSRSQERALITKNRAALLGFMSPLSFLLCIPYIGPLFILLAHSAAPVFLLDFLHHHQGDNPTQPVHTAKAH